MDNNKLIDRYKVIVDNISYKYKYDNNIRHLLYIIVPAFIKKYGVDREKLIINTFDNVKVFISDSKSYIINAFYTSIPRYIGDKIITDKMIVINNYEKISLVNLLDNLVHEFNHAVNSYNNEIKYLDGKLYLRTGLTWSIYDKNSLRPIMKDNSYVLEEIINTKQTEDVIDIIKSFNFVDDIISNTIYSINNETSDNYSSKAYYLESYICREILSNKTFISTLENLRISGNVSDIEDWFDNITSIDGSYNKFISYLNKIFNIEMELSKTKYFKKFKINRIRDMSRKVINIISDFNSNTNYN